MNPNQLISTVSNIGRLLLESGAEVYRVEETMVRIAQSFQVDHVESFVTPTVVMLSVTYEGQVYSNLIRIKHRNVDLNRIDCINTLSRKCWISPMSIEELQEETKLLEQDDSYPYYQRILFAGLVGFSFAFLFTGTWMDAVLAFFIAALSKMIFYALESVGIKGFLNLAITSGFIMLVSLSSVHLMPSIFTLDTLVISSLMLHVPGMEFTNAFRDTLAGDYLSGISRGIEAILVAVALAVGCGVVLSVWMSTVGGIV